MLKSPFVDSAIELMNVIHDSKVRTKDGSPTWLSPLANLRDSRQRPVGPHLYGGSLGIALALAAAGFQLEEERHRDLCLEAISPLRRLLKGLTEAPERAGIGLGVGGYSGLGGFIYGLKLCGQLLGEASLEEEAKALTGLLTEERIATDQIFDVISGAAGSLLVLVSLLEVEPRGDERDRLIAASIHLGDHLLRNQTVLDDRRAAWTTRKGSPPLTGFSHGAAGISYALNRLYTLTSDERYFDAAQRGLAYEDSCFEPKFQNWRDTRWEEPRFGGSWCHGAPGIALGRAAMLRSRDDDANLRAQALDGVEGMKRLPTSSLDHLCCGNMGRVDIFLEISHRLEDGQIRTLGESLADEILGRSPSISHWVESPRRAFGLLDGLAGVAFALLRLSPSSQLPCLLLLELPKRLNPKFRRINRQKM